MIFALFEGNDQSCWRLVAGTPPTWFANLWEPNVQEVPGDEECPHFVSPRVEDQFKNAKVFVRRSWEQNEQRDWIDLRI